MWIDPSEDGYFSSWSEGSLISSKVVAKTGSILQEFDKVGAKIRTSLFLYITEKNVMAVPIWKDHYVDFGNVESVDFEIWKDTDMVFSGRSYKKPGEVSLKVKINDICADYIEHANFNLKEGFASNEVAMEFLVYNDSGTVYETVTFVNDWSYDSEREDTGVLSDPINGIFDVRMPLLYSVSEEQTILIDAQDTSADFSIDFSADFFVGNDRAWEVFAQSAGTLTLRNVFDRSGDVKVGDLTYHGVLSCHTHALYYINAYGGWDFLLMEGRTIESDEYTRHEYRSVYDNSDITQRGLRNYLNEVQKSYVLHTGWMSKDQAAKMHHLFGSTQVFMYDLEKDQMIPVVVTDNGCRYKTYQNEGGKLVEYEINVKVAKSMIRR